MRRTPNQELRHNKLRMHGELTMRRFALGLLILIVMFSSNAKAWFLDGNKLYRDCTTKESDDHHFLNRSYCNGFVTGVTDMLGSTERLAEMTCLPDKVTVGQVRDVLIKYLKDHPEKRHLPAFVLVFNSQREAFPCEEKVESE